PMAMLPFCGYNMGDYFAHWLKIGTTSSRLPKIFYVNWFRQDDDGKYLCPGYGDNSRVLKWVFERCDGTVHAAETAVARLPGPPHLVISGLNLPVANLENLHSLAVEGRPAQHAHNDRSYNAPCNTQQNVHQHAVA